MKKNSLSLFLTLTFVFPPFAAAQASAKAKSSAREAAENITAAQMKDYLYFIASDEMEGRDTPSRGLDTTAKFIATNLSRWGVKPAGDDGTYFQKIALRSTFTDSGASSLEIDGQQYVLGDDFLRASGFTNGSVSAPLVYGSNGWLVKAKNIDALAGVDVKGKFVVLYSKNRSVALLPKGVTFQDLRDSGENGALGPENYAKQKGAAGIIIVVPDAGADTWSAQRYNYSRPRYAVEKTIGNDLPQQNTQPFPIILISQKAAGHLFAGQTKNPLASADENLPAFELSSNKKISLSLATKNGVQTTQNIIGIIEGSNSTLKNEMVAVGAHYDHLGVRPDAPGDDKIYNGADDDGSGTTGILAMAEALAKAPKKPKRSILFVWHCGEEKGLWGSRYFTSFPTVDLKNVIAQLNIDMIGRSRRTDDANPKNKELSGENEIFVIGSKMMSSQLGDVTDAVNKSFLNLNYNFLYDDPKDPNRFFFRSDHFNYAQKGIPIVFWFDGAHEDYHRPGDEPQRIDYAKMEKITRTVFLTMWELADSKERPKVDKQLPAEPTQK